MEMVCIKPYWRLHFGWAIRSSTFLLTRANSALVAEALGQREVGQLRLAQHQRQVHQRHAVHQPAVEFLRHAEQRAETDQIVEPVTPELDAAEYAPDQAREHHPRLPADRQGEGSRLDFADDIGRPEGADFEGLTAL